MARADDWGVLRIPADAGPEVRQVGGLPADAARRRVRASRQRVHPIHPNWRARPTLDHSHHSAGAPTGSAFVHPQRPARCRCHPHLPMCQVSAHRHPMSGERRSRVCTNSLAPVCSQCEPPRRDHRLSHVDLASAVDSQPHRRTSRAPAVSHAGCQAERQNRFSSQPERDCSAGDRIGS